MAYFSIKTIYSAKATASCSLAVPICSIRVGLLAVTVKQNVPWRTFHHFNCQVTNDVRDACFIG